MVDTTAINNMVAQRPMLCHVKNPALNFLAKNLRTTNDSSVIFK